MILELHVGRDVLWFRIFGWGLLLNGGRMHFSERYGHQGKPLLEVGRWRLRILKRVKKEGGA